MVFVPDCVTFSCGRLHIYLSIIDERALLKNIICFTFVTVSIFIKVTLFCMINIFLFLVWLSRDGYVDSTSFKRIDKIAWAFTISATLFHCGLAFLSYVAKEK